MKAVGVDKIDAERFITHRFPLAQIEDACQTFSAVGESGAIKVVIRVSDCQIVSGAPHQHGARMPGGGPQGSVIGARRPPDGDVAAPVAANSLMHQAHLGTRRNRDRPGLAAKERA